MLIFKKVFIEILDYFMVIFGFFFYNINIISSKMFIKESEFIFIVWLIFDFFCFVVVVIDCWLFVVECFLVGFFVVVVVFVELLGWFLC